MIVKPHGVLTHQTFRQVRVADFQGFDDFHVIDDGAVEAVTFGSSDHQSFLDRGFTAVGVCEEFVSGDHTPDYHEASDTFDKIDFAYLTEVTRLAMAILGDEVTAP